MSLPDPKMTPQEYLDAERAAAFKSEYFDGRMYAMSGVDRRHDKIAMNIGYLLSGLFWDRDCVVNSSDMRVKSEATGLYTYPDASAFCGEGRYEDETVDTLLNPTVIVEVLSPSTEAYDRGDKFEHYQTIPSVTDYVLVSSSHERVEHYVRQEDGRWLLTVHTDPDAFVDLKPVDARLQLRDIYHKLPPTRAARRLR